MATANPQIDWFHLGIQQIRDEADCLAYGDGGGVATDPAVPQVWFDGFERPRKSALMNDVLERPKIWKMGCTMVEIADRLSTDHTVVSRAIHWGEMSPGLENRILMCPNRPSDLPRVFGSVENAQYRKGFIAVATYLAARMATRRETSACGTLCEFQMELLSAMIEEPIDGISTADVAAEASRRSIVPVVCNDADRDCIPFWYTKRQARDIRQSIDRLLDDQRLAVRYLGSLCRRWQHPFVLAAAACEGLGWK